MSKTDLKMIDNREIFTTLTPAHLYIGHQYASYFVYIYISSIKLILI